MTISHTATKKLRALELSATFTETKYVFQIQIFRALAENPTISVTTNVHEKCMLCIIWRFQIFEKNGRKSFHRKTLAAILCRILPIAIWILLPKPFTSKPFSFETKYWTDFWTAFWYLMIDLNLRMLLNVGIRHLLMLLVKQGYPLKNWVEGLSD